MVFYCCSLRILRPHNFNYLPQVWLMDLPWDYYYITNAVSFYSFVALSRSWQQQKPALQPPLPLIWVFSLHSSACASRIYILKSKAVVRSGLEWNTTHLKMITIELRLVDGRGADMKKEGRCCSHLFPGRAEQKRHKIVGGLKLPKLVFKESRK